jgi:hypothetical protein
LSLNAFELFWDMNFEFCFLKGILGFSKEVLNITEKILIKLSDYFFQIIFDIYTKIIRIIGCLTVSRQDICHYSFIKIIHIITKNATIQTFQTG